MPSLEARLSSNILWGSRHCHEARSPSTRHPFHTLSGLKEILTLIIYGAIFSSWILRTNSLSSLSKDRFTAAWILHILWRALCHRSAWEQPREGPRGCTAPILLLSAFLLNPQKALTAIPGASSTKWWNVEDRKMRIRKCFFLLSTTLPLCHGSPSPP